MKSFKDQLAELAEDWALDKGFSTPRRVLVHELIRRFNLAVEAMEKIADPRKRDHKEPDDYTEKCCLMHIANEALKEISKPFGDEKMINPTPDFESFCDEVYKATSQPIDDSDTRIIFDKYMKAAFEAGREKGRVEAIAALLESPKFVKAYNEALKEKEPV